MPITVRPGLSPSLLCWQLVQTRESDAQHLAGCRARRRTLSAAERPPRRDLRSPGASSSAYTPAPRLGGACPTSSITSSRSSAEASTRPAICNGRLSPKRRIRTASNGCADFLTVYLLSSPFVGFGRPRLRQVRDKPSLDSGGHGSLRVLRALLGWFRGIGLCVERGPALFLSRHDVLPSGSTHIALRLGFCGRR